MKTWFAIVSVCLAAGWAGAEDAATKGHLITDFRAGHGVEGWQVEDDGVMGGVSKGSMSRTEEGYGVFSGEVSLENNGGFSSIQMHFDAIDVSAYSSVVVRVKGDGKPYKFLVESSREERHYYVFDFQTGTDWETIVIPFAEMTPHWRGDRLDQPNYAGKTLAMVRFMIANGRAETFRLLVDRIELR